MAALIAGVWYGFKWLGRMQEMQAERNRENRNAAKKRSKSKYGHDDAPDDDVEDMVQADDGTWVPASQKNKHNRR